MEELRPKNKPRFNKTFDLFYYLCEMYEEYYETYQFID